MGAERGVTYAAHHTSAKTAGPGPFSGRKPPSSPAAKRRSRFKAELSNFSDKSSVHGPYRDNNEAYKAEPAYAR